MQRTPWDQRVRAEVLKGGCLPHGNTGMPYWRPSAVKSVQSKRVNYSKPQKLTGGMDVDELMVWKTEGKCFYNSGKWRTETARMRLKT